MDLLIGESYAGGDGNEAHINVLAGPRAGPIGAAFATTLANPKPGHVPFLAVLQPNIPVVPATVLINKSTLSDAAQGTIFWGAVQAGVAAGVREALDAGALQGQDLGAWALIVAAWNNPAAADEEAVFENNRNAMCEALLRADGKLGYAGDYRDGTLEPHNPFFRLPH